MPRPGGGGDTPSDTKVAQVIPDSGVYWAVWPGMAGMRISTWQAGH
jgi:hypothetical protein